jgi:CheY-like chemotaxis protein
METRAPRLLLVEDNELNLEALSRLLMRKGFRVVPARTGGEGVAAAASGGIDVVLMDIGLPDMDGLEAVRRILKNPACEGLPIIALTAHALTTDRDKALAAGCVDFDTKPVDFPRLCSKIAALIAAKRELPLSGA